MSLNNQTISQKLVDDKATTFVVDVNTCLKMPQALFEWYMQVLQVLSVEYLHQDFSGTIDQIFRLEKSISIFDVAMVSYAVTNKTINPQEVFIVKYCPPKTAKEWVTHLTLAGTTQDLAKLDLCAETPVPRPASPLTWAEMVSADEESVASASQLTSKTSEPVIPKSKTKKAVPVSKSGQPVSSVTQKKERNPPASTLTAQQKKLRLEEKAKKKLESIEAAAASRRSVSPAPPKVDRRTKFRMEPVLRDSACSIVKSTRLAKTLGVASLLNLGEGAVDKVHAAIAKGDSSFVLSGIQPLLTTLTLVFCPTVPEGCFNLSEAAKWKRLPFDEVYTTNPLDVNQAS